MITLSRNNLKAALCVTPKKDLRNYLNGVHIVVDAEGGVLVQATDGHCAFETKEPVAAMSRGADIIIPRADVEALCKSGFPMIEITPRADGKWEGCGVVFTPIDGKFPDIARVMPAVKPEMGEVGQFDPEIVLAITKALREAAGGNRQVFRLIHQGTSVGYMDNGVDVYPRCCIMPYRV